MKNRKAFYYYLDKVSKMFEIAIASLLLIVLAVKLLDLVFALTGVDITLLTMDFEQILSIAFSLIVGVEFIRMLYKHTPDTVIDVLLFAIARQMVLYHEGTIHMMVGVLAIAGLYAAKKYLIGRNNDKSE